MVCVRHQNIELQDMLVSRDYEEGLANIKRKSVLEGKVEVKKLESACSQPAYTYTTT